MGAFYKSSSDIFNTVVKYGFCIGCGACAAFDKRIRIKLDEYGRYVAWRQPDNTPSEPATARVCPFADGALNEDDLAHEAFGRSGALDPHIGYRVAAYAGWVVESDFRERGSSGGLASWLLVELLSRGLVDHVVHVAPESAPFGGKPLFRFAVSSTWEEVRARSKSRYYPVEMSEAIGEMLRRPGRYAMVGIPCFVKALRLACRESSVLKERVTFTVGLVCGHLKSTAFAEVLGWQCGITSDELKAIDFRSKLPDRPASNYAVTVSAERDGRRFSVTKPNAELFGSNWGQGFFKYKACDFCDDVIGETADISIGDAWLHEYESDAAGTNVVVVRAQTLNSLLTDAVKLGRLHLDAIAVGKVVESQAGGFRHRRDGLAYRLFLEDQAGRWRPTKRVKASADQLTLRLRKIYALRQQLAEASHAAFAAAKAKQDFGVFLQSMRPLVARYERQYRQPFLFRILGRIKRIANVLLSPKR
jgi:coenzyme F420 hydrogenase subunit beta